MTAFRDDHVALLERVAHLEEELAAAQVDSHVRLDVSDADCCVIR